DVVVELVAHVPAQDHVAEAHAAVERRMELVNVDVLAAQDAVDVVDAHLDVAQPASFVDPAGVGHRFDLTRFHRSVPPLIPFKSQAHLSECRRGGQLCIENYASSYENTIPRV